jgi:hypothetical protein
MFYVTIRPTGGFGNQLFMVAAALGYAERHGHTVVFLEPPTVGVDHPASALRIADVFGHIPVRPDLVTLPWTVLQEGPNDAFTYRSLPSVQGHVRLVGYFQSVAYFPSTLLPVPSCPSITSLDFLTNDWSKTFFLHVRLGDYLHPANAHHRVDLSAYYRTCLATMDPTWTCLLVSDDPEVAQNSIKWSGHTLVCSCSDAETFWWMTLCAGGICANSTFSWWAAYYLTGNGSRAATVYMPALWGNPPLPPAMDLYPPWAQKIEIFQ